MPARILVVEDDSFIREVISTTLVDEGYVVDQADDGARAWAYLSQQRPDLVVLDLGLPLMDGLTVCRNLRLLEETQFRKRAPVPPAGQAPGVKPPTDLPSGSGTDLSSGIGPAHTCVLVVSALNSHRIHKTAIEAGADVFLEKPFDLVDFIRHVTDLLDGADVTPSSAGSRIPGKVGT